MKSSIAPVCMCTRYKSPTSLCISEALQNFARERLVCVHAVRHHHCRRLQHDGVGPAIPVLVAGVVPAGDETFAFHAYFHLAGTLRPPLQEEIVHVVAAHQYFRIVVENASYFDLFDELHLSYKESVKNTHSNNATCTHMRVHARAHMHACTHNNNNRRNDSF